MKKTGKSIFEFWGIPARDADFFSRNKSIFINKNRLIKSNSRLKLETGRKIRPNWLKKDIYIYFPKVYKNESKGEVLAYFIDKGERLPAIVREGKRITFNFDPEETIDFILAEQYVKKKRPIYTFLPFHYHKIPFRIFIARLITLLRSKLSKEEHNAEWPVEGEADVIRGVFLNSLNLIKKLKVKDFWPEKKKFAVALTHDIDTKHGFRNIGMFSGAEERKGFRSTWFLVGSYYKKDYNKLDELVKKGHEIGLHGYNHDNKIAYLPLNKIERRLEKCREFTGRYCVKGFRSPSLLNSKNLEKALGKYFSYDSTVPTNERYMADSDYSGCGSAFPYFKEGILEIPISLPMDSSLLFLNWDTGSIFNLWVKKLEWIRAIGGVAVLNVHPEPHFSGNKKMLDLYKKFIDHISTMDDAWVTTMGEIEKQWRKRNQD